MPGSTLAATPSCQEPRGAGATRRRRVSPTSRHHASRRRLQWASARHHACMRSGGPNVPGLDTHGQVPTAHALSRPSTRAPHSHRGRRPSARRAVRMHRLLHQTTAADPATQASTYMSTLATLLRALCAQCVSNITSSYYIPLLKIITTGHWHSARLFLECSALGRQPTQLEFSCSTTRHNEFQSSPRGRKGGGGGHRVRTVIIDHQHRRLAVRRYGDTSPATAVGSRAPIPLSAPVRAPPRRAAPAAGPLPYPTSHSSTGVVGEQAARRAGRGVRARPVAVGAGRPRGRTGMLCDEGRRSMQSAQQAGAVALAAQHGQPKQRHARDVPQLLRAACTHGSHAWVITMTTPMNGAPGSGTVECDAVGHGHAYAATANACMCRNTNAKLQPCGGDAQRPWHGGTAGKPHLIPH